MGSFVREMLDKPLVLPNIDRKPEVNNAKFEAAIRDNS